MLICSGAVEQHVHMFRQSCAMSSCAQTKPRKQSHYTCCTGQSMRCVRYAYNRHTFPTWLMVLAHYPRWTSQVPCQQNGNRLPLSVMPMESPRICLAFFGIERQFNSGRCDARRQFQLRQLRTLVRLRDASSLFEPQSQPLVDLARKIGAGIFF